MASRRDQTPDRYPLFRRLDGRHPFKRAVPDGFVEYGARRRRDGEVAYFNFGLAREMGLIPHSHPDRLTAGLRRAILDTFCIVILNEYDLAKGVRVPARDRLDRRYMATRYLQLQHPGRRGETSGDGRSVWNGCLRHRGIRWDVSSCGTGVTRLCPATAIENKFFKTGTRIASYGCGTAALAEGFGAALMSETFHRNGIPTERVLAVIALPGGRAINVRAAHSLMRPSHFLGHLKQGNLEALRGAVDHYYERCVANGDWPDRAGPERYRAFALEAATTFGRVTATFESEYIFCWLDWDGDNILADGGIIDYGSVRQFGLYHREYRFDDVSRMSTTIPEQRAKARAIVKNYAQIRDFLISARKRPLRCFDADPVLERFDREFAATRTRLLLRNVGFTQAESDALLKRAPQTIERFRSAHAHFERARSSRGPGPCPDGITWNAVFSTRDLLRELPCIYLESGAPLDAHTFLAVAASSYASRSDRAVTPHRRRMASSFQRAYLELVAEAADATRCAVGEVVVSVAQRSALINRFDRITGDSIEYAANELVRRRRRITGERMHQVIDAFVRHQILDPDSPEAVHPGESPRKLMRCDDARSVLDLLVRTVGAYRYGR